MGPVYLLSKEKASLEECSDIGTCLLHDGTTDVGHRMTRCQTITDENATPTHPLQTHISPQHHHQNIKGTYSKLQIVSLASIWLLTILFNSVVDTAVVLRTQTTFLPDWFRAGSAGVAVRPLPRIT